jgi:hypothetical protein
VHFIKTLLAKPLTKDTKEVITSFEEKLKNDLGQILGFDLSFLRPVSSAQMSFVLEELNFNIFRFCL